MTLMVWKLQTIRVFFLIWQQFSRIWKVEKSLILRDFRGLESDIKFEFYEDIKNHSECKIYREKKSKGIGFRKESFMIFDEDLCIKWMKTLPQKRIKEIALWHHTIWQSQYLCGFQTNLLSIWQQNGNILWLFSE